MSDVGASLPRRLVAEGLGSCLLVTVVVGSGIAAQRLSTGDVGLQLLESSTATGLGLAVLVVVLAPISGAHLNPLVSVADWVLGRRSPHGLPGRDVTPYVASQVLGAGLGAELANLMYRVPVERLSHHHRSGGNLVLGEVVATAGLVLVVFGLARTQRSHLAGPAVGAYIAAAYWFTSSTSFANPAVAVARMLSDSFAGIAPASVPAFVAAQIVGAGLALALVGWLYGGVDHD